MLLVCPFVSACFRVKVSLKTYRDSKDGVTDLQSNLLQASVMLVN